MTSEGDAKTGRERDTEMGGKRGPDGVKCRYRFNGGVVGVEDGFEDRWLARVGSGRKKKSSKWVQGAVRKGWQGKRRREVNASGERDVQYATFQEEKEGLNLEDSVTSLACLSRLFKHVSTLT